MTTSHTVRLAHLQDLTTLVSFNQALAQEVREKGLDSQILTAGVQAVLSDSKRGFYTVVEVEERAVAAALVTFEWSDWRNAWFWWLQDVYVEPNYRQQGIFRSLYQHLKAQAQIAKACGLRLYVYQGNMRAQKVYQRLGMVPASSVMFEESLELT
jgi:GNAT superfamily N-acetyltransferase